MNDRLKRQLLDQQWIRSSEQIVDAIIGHVQVESFQSEAVIYSPAANSRGYSLWMVLVGSVTLRYNGHDVASLGPGECFGEFPLRDPGLPLSVEATATGGSAIGRISEKQFQALATTNPAVGLNLARILVQRLMRANAIYRRPNVVPVVFVGSSTEALPALTAFQNEFADDDDLEVLPWTEKVFEASETAINL